MEGLRLAHFYGELKGRGRSLAARHGSKRDGLRTEAFGWTGGVRVEMSCVGGVDYVTVEAVGNRRRGEFGVVRTLYDGPLTGLFTVTGSFADNAPSLGVANGMD